MSNRWGAAAALVAWLAVCGPALAGNGGGPVAAVSDRASDEIDAIHPTIVQRARGLGLPVLDAAAAAIELLQFPLRATAAEKSLQSHAVSNYVDMSAGSGIRDFSCGNSTFDGHKGTDLFLWPFPWRAMDQRETEVVAALGGTIIGKRDGDYDRQCSWSTSDTGNHVVVQHDNGLIAYYWHLQKGTVTSKAIGSRVETGEKLGYVGSSGKSTGPHLHFEVRNASGAVIEPARGTCNDTATRWAHQAAKIDTAIIDVSTHSAPPSGGSQCRDPSQNYDDVFERGRTVYAMGVFRDQYAGAKAVISILQPNGSTAASWKTGSPSSGIWAASYWYMGYNLPSTAPAGLWRARVTIAGQSAEHTFAVASSISAGRVTASVASPTRTVRAGQASNFRVTVNNGGTAKAVGCRVSLGRPILATTAFRRLDASGNPVGLAGEAFSVAASRSTNVNLTITPKTGFAAKAAEFPLRVTCTNTPAAPFSRTATMLVLSSP
ncbi:MAG: peptidoglycan DD-metalloendopeptidase family protein [Hyphomicrobiales bacterium]